MAAQCDKQGAAIFILKNNTMNIREFLFYIFRAKYYVTRMKLETLHKISRVTEETYLLIKEDHTIRWREIHKEATAMGYFQSWIWVAQLRRMNDEFIYSRVTFTEYNTMHYLGGASTALFI